MLQLETPSQVTRLLRQVLSCSKGFQKAFVAVDGSEIWQTHQLGLVVAISFFTGFQKHPNGGWEWDFWTINNITV